MPDPVEKLVTEGLLRRVGTRTRTTPRWQAAMARAALGLQRASAPWKDLRLPIVAALVELFPDASDEEVVDLVEAMMGVEEVELAPILGQESARP